MAKKLEAGVTAQMITRRLDAIISLLAQTGNRKVGESIVLLNNAGLRPVEISRILQRSESHVNKELALARKVSPRRRKKRVRGSRARGQRKG